jgi:uncharacterized membrane protein
MNDSPKQRLAYIDWMRGFACLMMFQTHCYDSWLGGAAREGKFIKMSQLGGTLPAPLFLFLAGISFALITDRLRAKNVPRKQIARQTIRRGAEILGLGLLFRVQEWLLGQPSAPWTDLLRVDVLNIIGVSIMLMGVVTWLVALASATADPAKLRLHTILVAAAAAMAISMLTPLMWTTWRPRWLPWYLESYINGVHIYNKPQPWLFPMFPWAAFAFAGLAAGFLLLMPLAKKHEIWTVSLFAMAGGVIWVVASWADSSGLSLYPVYDFWHTSPNFFLMRVAILLWVTLFAYVWSRWGLAAWIFSPLKQLGKTSLLVYWVHIEFVYGAFSILKKRSQTVETASIGLAIIFVAMVLLSLLRTRLKGRGAEILGWLRLAPRRAERPAG